MINTLIIWDLLIFFFAAFFQKQASKDHLIQGNLLKTMLLNEKNKAILKRKYMKISLYTSNIFHLAQEVINVHKLTYFGFLKLRKKYFILSS